VLNRRLSPLIAASPAPSSIRNTPKASGTQTVNLILTRHIVPVLIYAPLHERCVAKAAWFWQTLSVTEAVTIPSLARE
jgi:hypothetical protein